MNLAKFPSFILSRTYLGEGVVAETIVITVTRKKMNGRNTFKFIVVVAKDVADSLNLILIVV